MNDKIAVIGLGYVGMPLAIELGKNFHTIGYDLNKKRIDELKHSIDNVTDITKEDFNKSKKISFSSNLSDLKKCNVFIIAVPTPIDKNNKPDLKNLFNATKNVATILSKNDIVIYESTVYPGCTEEECAPLLERESSYGRRGAAGAVPPSLSRPRNIISLSRRGTTLL